jgi:integrase
MTGFPARSATFSTRRKAERWAKTIEAEMIEGRHFRNAEARRRSLGDTIDRYIRDELPKKSDQTPKGQLLWWKDRIGDIKLADVTPALIVEQRDKLAAGKYRRAKPDAKYTEHKKGVVPREYPRAPATVNRYLAALSRVFTVARKEWHWAAHNPVDDVSRFGEGERVRWLSEDERKALLTETAKDPVLHTFVLLALSTACRAGELLKLEWRDVDVETGRILFRKTKNRQARSVWLHGEALAALEAHGKMIRELSGRVFVNPGGSRRKRGEGVYDYGGVFSAAVAATGIRDFRFHDLRHTAATYLAQEGATEQQLRAIGGWKSNVVNRYVHLAAKDTKAQLERLAKKIAFPQKPVA